LTAIEPLLGHARNSLREGIRALRGTRPALLFTTEPVEPELVQILQGRLFMMIGRTFALELNVARLQGRLHGDTPEDRFQSFLRQLGNHGAALALLLEYPAPAAVPAGRARLLAAARAIGDRLEALVDRLPPLIERDAYLDVIGGAAGGVGSLASLFRYAPSAPVLRAARLCGDRLVACARPMEHGVGWMLPQVGGVPLAGFSHGAAGMAWALLELAGLTGDDRYRSTAIAALDYERSLFSAVEGNWPDLRRQGSTDQTADDGGQSFMVAWYHGAPGIALARLRSLGHLDDPTTRAEIDAALTTTRTGGFGGNHSSCHGDLGNLEPLLHAARTLGSVHCRAEAEGMAAAILAGIGQDGPRCSAPLEVETPGLMSGLAGIGHGLLRAAAPDEVPSVLALAPPC
jgi:lantibiotic modifying enzyme